MSTESSESGGTKPKLIIDEDWKSQVQAEKEALERQKGHSPEPQPQAAADAGPLPPATLAMLLTTLATQALVGLGQIPHPASGKAEIYLEEAKHLIYTWEMLESKTTGNRTPEEDRLLENLLHELRLGFVEMQAHLAAK